MLQRRSVFNFYFVPVTRTVSHSKYAHIFVLLLFCDFFFFILIKRLSLFDFCTRNCVILETDLYIFLCLFHDFFSDVNLVAEPKPHQTGRKRQNLSKTGNDW